MMANKPFILLQVRPETEASNNEYEAFLKFSGLTNRQLARLRIEKGDIAPINLNDYSGVILGGGPYNASDPDDKKSEAQKKCESWLYELLDRVIGQDFPFLGSCYGIGILGTHQKGLISRKYGEDVGAVSVNLTKEGQSDKLTKNLPRTFRAFVGHKEACEILPVSATLLASSDTCPVQIFRIKTNIYATQFHTELDADGLALRIKVYKHAGYFPPHEAEILIEKASVEKVTEPEKILAQFIKNYQ